MIDNPQTDRRASLSPAFADALQNARHALLTEDPAQALARVLTQFHDEHRAEVLRDAEEICDEAGASYTAKALYEHARAAYGLMARFRRKAEEAEKPAVLPAVPVPPTTHATDRAAVYREAADDLATAFGDPMAKHIGAIGASHLRRRAREIEAGRDGLRRMADEAQQQTPATVLLETADRIDAAPLPPDHPDTFISGVRWTTGQIRHIAREEAQQQYSAHPTATTPDDEES